MYINELKKAVSFYENEGLSDCPGKITNELKDLLTVIERLDAFDIEDYIQSLPWDTATDYEQTLVAGNLRRLFYKLIKEISEVDNFDKIETKL